MSLGIAGISLSPQSKFTVDQIGKGDVKENTKSNQGKRQFVTEREGNYECTYVVIGENIKVLIGRVATNKDEDKDEPKTEDMNKKDIYALNKDQTLMGYQQLVTATLPKSNPQERVQAVENYAVSSYFDIAKVNAKG